MATLPKQDPKQHESDEAAVEMARLLEGFFDSEKLNEEERDRRVAKAGQRITSAAGNAKSEEFLQIVASRE